MTCDCILCFVPSLVFALGIPEKEMDEIMTWGYDRKLIAIPATGRTLHMKKLNAMAGRTSHIIDDNMKNSIEGIGDFQNSLHCVYVPDCGRNISKPKLISASTSFKMLIAAEKYKDCRYTYKCLDPFFYSDIYLPSEQSEENGCVAPVCGDIENGQRKQGKYFSTYVGGSDDIIIYNIIPVIIQTAISSYSDLLMDLCNRKDVYASQQADGSYISVKTGITEELLKEHIPFTPSMLQMHLTFTILLKAWTKPTLFSSMCLPYKPKVERSPLGWCVSTPKLSWGFLGASYLTASFAWLYACIARLMYIDLFSIPLLRSISASKSSCTVIDIFVVAMCNHSSCSFIIESKL